MGDPGSIPGLGRSPGEGERKGDQLQYSCLEKPMKREAWQATPIRLQSVRQHWWLTVSLSLPVVLKSPYRTHKLRNSPCIWKWSLLLYGLTIMEFNFWFVNFNMVSETQDCMVCKRINFKIKFTKFKSCPTTYKWFHLGQGTYAPQLHYYMSHSLIFHGC